jgi:hypothetical protein
MTNSNYSNQWEQAPKQESFNTENLSSNDDLIMEHILENINATPIGQVLKKIASLPEVRQRKILRVRRELTEGHYDINKRLDVALDKVLEDLIK